MQDDFSDSYSRVAAMDSEDDDMIWGAVAGAAAREAAKKLAKELIRKMAKKMVQMVMKKLTKEAMKKQIKFMVAKFLVKTIAKKTAEYMAQGKKREEAHRLAEQEAESSAAKVLRRSQWRIEREAIEAGDDYIDKKLKFRWIELIPLYGDYKFAKKVYEVVYSGELEAVVETTIDFEIKKILCEHSGRRYKFNFGKWKMECV